MRIVSIALWVATLGLALFLLLTGYHRQRERQGEPAVSPRLVGAGLVLMSTTGGLNLFKTEIVNTDVTYAGKELLLLLGYLLLMLAIVLPTWRQTRMRGSGGEEGTPGSGHHGAS